MPTGLLIISTRWLSSCTAIKFACDRVRDVAQLLLLLLKVLGRRGGSVFIEPVGGFLNGFKELERYLAKIE